MFRIFVHTGEASQDLTIRLLKWINAYIKETRGRSVPSIQVSQLTDDQVQSSKVREAFQSQGITSLPALTFTRGKAIIGEKAICEFLLNVAREPVTKTQPQSSGFIGELLDPNDPDEEPHGEKMTERDIHARMKELAKQRSASQPKPPSGYQQTESHMGQPKWAADADAKRGHCPPVQSSGFDPNMLAAPAASVRSGSMLPPPTDRANNISYTMEDSGMNEDILTQTLWGPAP